ncbi:MAG TPA: class I SAM-dependent methyltransferase [Pyrinomonadaceae bacterium]|nr:class I SAM-dependent methyltransferase [Pyrinomonadaceae bacterium]
MVAAKSDAYDNFSYLNYAYPQTHPDRMGSLAHLFGMDPAPVDNCRVLELGCGDGANLLPLAVIAPESEFVGIDRAKTPIANGQAMIQVLELTNIKLLELDLTALPDALGQFDYIIAHGLYSWIPAQIRDAMLALCRSRLNPHGVAYISYNAYPGCHLRAIVRDAMRFHTSAINDPRERVAQGRSLIKWLAEAHSDDSPYQVVLKEFSEHLQNKNEAAVFHDDLADINSPVYFHEFITHAGQHGLQFLSEAVYFDSTEYNFRPAVAEALRELGRQTPISKEQYLDLIEGRTFRQTLLCHHEHKLDRSLRPELVKDFLLRSQARPVSSEINLEANVVEKFESPHRAAISTGFPLVKAALLHLGEIYPSSASFEGLMEVGRQRLGRLFNTEDAAGGQDKLAEVLMKAYAANVVELHLHEPKLINGPSESPRASALARLQAQKDGLCTSLLHDTIKFEDFLARQLIILLDGTHDREALRQELLKSVEANTGPNSKEAAEQKAELLQRSPDKLEQKLVELAKLAFLIE